MNFPYSITKWYKHMETHHTYPSMTPVHNLKLSVLGNYTANLPVSDMNEEKIFSCILW